MSFKINDIRKNTEINHELIYSFARNDDVNKAIYESSSQGIICWAELESSVSVPQKDPEIQADSTEDPNWSNVFAVKLFAEDEHAIGIKFWALSNVFDQSTGSSATWVPGIRARLYLEYASTEDDEAYSKEIYQAIGPFEWTSFASASESGMIRGNTTVVATTNYATTDSNLLAKYANLDLIPSGEMILKLDVNRLNTTQTITSSLEEKTQMIVTDLGVWR
jgi:hypothetical protein